MLKQYGLALEDWRNLDISSQVIHFLKEHQNTTDPIIDQLRQEIKFQHDLRHISEQAKLEESHLICQLIADIILPIENLTDQYVELVNSQAKPKVGSCPMAEDFFLQIAHHRILRQGSINIFVDHQQRPILLEKMNMGDNHSCISLVPVLINGVRLPAGSLFSLDYDLEQIADKRPNKQVRGISFLLKPLHFGSYVSPLWRLALKTVQELLRPILNNRLIIIYLAQKPPSYPNWLILQTSKFR